MLNTSSIATAFYGLVGFRKAPDTFAWTETPANSYVYDSSSGYFFDDLSDLVSMQNLNDFKREDEDLESFLVRIINQASLDVVNDYYQKRSMSQYAKTLIQNQPFVVGAGSIGNQITKQGRFVGYQLRLKASSNISVLIKQISLQLSQAQTLNLYLYSSQEQEPIHTFILNYDTANSVKWFNLEDDLDKDIYLNRNDSDSYYLGYFEEDLSGNALYKKYDGKPCNCNSTVTKLNKYISAYPISFQSSVLSGTTLPDIDAVGYEGYNFGLNLKPFVYCDLSEILIQHKEFFSQAIQIKGAMAALERIFNTAQLSNKSMSSAIGQNAFNAWEQMKEEYVKALDSVTLEFSGLDHDCMPPNRNRITMSRLLR